MAVAITNSSITALNGVLAAETLSPATSDVDDATEAFTYTPTGGRAVFAIYNGAGHGAITYSVAAGAFPQGVAAKTGSVAAGARAWLDLETGRYKSSAGTVVVTLTPASGKALLTDHASGMVVLEIPG